MTSGEEKRDGMKLITIGRFLNYGNAEIAKNVLAENGIRACIFDGPNASDYRSLLQVADCDETRAIEVLQLAPKIFSEDTTFL